MVIEHWRMGGAEAHTLLGKGAAFDWLAHVRRSRASPAWRPRGGRGGISPEGDTCGQVTMILCYLEVDFQDFRSKYFSAVAGHMES